MQGLKNMEASVREKVENASTTIGEKKADARIAAEEKVEKLKAHGDESAKEEIAERRREREEEAGRKATERKHENEAEKEGATDPHPGSIGDRPTPADLGMTSESPYTPGIGPRTTGGPAIPNGVGPYGGTVA